MSCLESSLPERPPATPTLERAIPSRGLDLLTVAALIVAAVVWGGVGAEGHALAAGAGKPKKESGAKAAAQPRSTPLPEVRPSGSLASQYCSSIADRAAEARYAHQTAALDALAGRIETQLAKLEAKNAQLESWLAERRRFMDQATAQLVGIYAAMRPEAAAEQLVQLEPATAAAILARLDPRAASAILNDMPAAKAAALASLLGKQARTEKEKSR